MKPVLDSNGIVIKGVFRGTNGSLIVDDVKLYESAVLQKAKISESNNRIENLENQLTNLSSDIEDIKRMLKTLVDTK